VHATPGAMTSKQMGMLKDWENHSTKGHNEHAHVEATINFEMKHKACMLPSSIHRKGEQDIRTYLANHKRRPWKIRAQNLHATFGKIIHQPC